ncbi:MAG TPA: hypothetical protein VGO57_09615 [Verrucomicrobiae bacterium]
MPRSWLVADRVHRDHCGFDPDLFHEQIGVWSSGERLGALFLLNVWNPGYARDKGWFFNIMDAAGTFDPDNMGGIIEWLQHPIFP